MRTEAGNDAVSPDAILRRLAPLIARQLGIQAAEITPDVYLEDLGASSLDLVEITLDAEREFDVLLAGRPLFDAAVLKFGPGTLEEDGELTDAGRRLVKKRFAHLGHDEAAAMIDIADIQRQVSRVSVWTETIAQLAAEIPARCLEHGGQARLGNGGIPACENAGDDYLRPSLDEWNEAWLSRLYDEGSSA